MKPSPARPIFIYALAAIVGFILIVGIVSTFFPQHFHRIAVMDPLTRDMAHLKTIRGCLQGYADEHQGQFPDSLPEFLDQTLDAETAAKVKYFTRTDDNRPSAWIYRPTPTTARPDTILVASAPFTRTRKNPGQYRLVARLDGTTAEIPEEEYQRMIRP